MSRDTLLYGLRTQLAADGAETTQQIARFLLEQRPSLRLLDRALRSSPRFARAFAVINATRWRMREVGPQGGVLACAYRANERRAVDELRAIVDGAWCDVEIGVGVGPVEPRRLGRIANTLARSYEPFRMLRGVEMLAFHARLGRMLDRGYRVAVMSSYSNPWGIALNVAARRRGIPIVLVMHGMPQWPVPQLDYDLAIVNNRAAHETLTRAGCQIGRAIVKSGLAQYRPMSVLPAQVTVGVLLSKDPEPAQVKRWLAALTKHPKVAKVIVRKHPANLWTGVDAAAESAARISMSTEASSLDDVRRCDLVIASNSSVHVDAVVAGVPSIYAPGLDRAGDDVLGFVRDGLIVPCADPEALDLERAAAFYARPAWRAALGRLVNIEQDEAAVAAEIRAAFRELGA